MLEVAHSALVKENGNLHSSISVALGVYAPTSPVERIFKFGRSYLHFPAQVEWYCDGAQARPMVEWHGWKAAKSFQPMSVLDEFLKVEDEDAVFKFAQKYGPIWVCGESRHKPLCLWQGINISDECGVLHRWQNPEPVGAWLALAVELRAVIELHLRLSGEWRRLDKEPFNWEAFSFWPGKDPRKSSDARWMRQANAKLAKNLDLSRALLRGIVNARLHRYNIGLLLDNKLKPVFHAGLGFVPALWQQVAAVLAGGDTIALCCACCRYYRPKRAPKRSQLNYCAKCKQLRVPQKEWSNKQKAIK